MSLIALQPAEDGSYHGSHHVSNGRSDVKHEKSAQLGAFMQTAAVVVALKFTNIRMDAKYSSDVGIKIRFFTVLRTLGRGGTPSFGGTC